MHRAPQSPSRFSGSQGLVGLLALLIVILGYMVFTLRSDVSRLSEAAVSEQSVRTLSERVAGIEELALAGVPKKGELEADLQRLERAVFGPFVPPSSLGSLQDRVDALESCVTRGFSVRLRCS